MQRYTLEERYINRAPLLELLHTTFPACARADFKVEVRPPLSIETRKSARILSSKDSQWPVQLHGPKAIDGGERGISLSLFQCAAHR
jgi:hypothetical protein